MVGDMAKNPQRFSEPKGRRDLTPKESGHGATVNLLRGVKPTRLIHDCVRIIKFCIKPLVYILGF